MIDSRDGSDQPGSAHTTVDFGYEQVDRAAKQGRVGQVFDSVADNYDVMNDLMSMGVHRLWKRFTISLAALRTGDRVLDLASGTGDLAAGFAKKVGPTGRVLMSDINAAMLANGRNRMIDRGIVSNIDYCLANAEKLPFADDSFDAVTIAFGLRNVTDKDAALAEMARVTRPGGRTIVLERPGMAITLDAIAKGFVVDRAVATLTAAGADRVIVDAGGDMATRTTGDDPWQVAIQNPHDPKGSLGVVQLRGESLGSSGDYMQYFTPDRRLNHTIDPRTGRSPQHSSGSSVRAPTAMDADALSTAVFVLGPREGIALLDGLERIEGMLVTKAGELFASRGFPTDSGV